MAIYKPSNLSPDLNELDIHNPDGNTFSCQVNTSGSSVKAYKMGIVSGNGEQFFSSDIKNLKPPVKNKGLLRANLKYNSDENKIYIDNDSGKLLEAGKVLTNGKDYQWNVRTYENNAPRLQGQKPSTLVCTGYLTGSTTYVVWTENNEKIEEDRYLEFHTPADKIEEVMFPILPPNTENKTLPRDFKIIEEQNEVATYAELEAYSGPVSFEDIFKVTSDETKEGRTTYYKCIDNDPVTWSYYGYVVPETYSLTGKSFVFKDFRERQKISFIDKELGWDKDITKIELDDKMEYNYKNDSLFVLYKCSDKHTYKSFFADPNDAITLGNFVEILNENGSVTLEERRKIVGYSNDTGEIRVQEAFSNIPVNGQTYRVWEYDITTKEYKQKTFTVSNLIGGAPIYADQEELEEFKVITNKWDATQGGVKQLFVQPNVNVKTDDANPDQMIFDMGGQVININKKVSTQYIPRKLSDVTFNKLDNSQWLLKCYDDSVSSGTVFTDLDITPKNTYKIYTDFMDSMPNGTFYARTLPEIVLKAKDLRNEPPSVIYSDINDDLRQAYENLGSRDYITIEIQQDDNEPIIDVPPEASIDTPSGENEGIIPIRDPQGEVQVVDDEEQEEYNADEQNRYRLIYYHENANTSILNLYDEIKDLDIEKQYKYKAYLNSEGQETIIGDGSWKTANFYQYLISPDETKETTELNYRDAKFVGEWKQNEDVEIKYYNYTLYYINQYNDEEEIASSGDKYDIDLTWEFKAFETDNRYKIRFEIVDQYNQPYSFEKTFYVSYEVELSRFPSTYSLLCDETAVQVQVSLPSYVGSNKIPDKQNVNIDNLYNQGKKTSLIIGENQALNYANVVGSTSENITLEIPEQFNYFTEFSFPSSIGDSHYNFFSDIKGLDEKVITSVANQKTEEFFIDENVEALSQYLLTNDVYMRILLGDGQILTTKQILSYEEETGKVTLNEDVVTTDYNNLFYRLYTIIDSERIDIPVEDSDYRCYVANDLYEVKIGGIDSFINVDDRTLWIEKNVDAIKEVLESGGSLSIVFKNKEEEKEEGEEEEGEEEEQLTEKEISSYNLLDGKLTLSEDLRELPSYDLNYEIYETTTSPRRSINSGSCTFWSTEPNYNFLKCKVYKNGEQIECFEKNGAILNEYDILEQIQEKDDIKPEGLQKIFALQKEVDYELIPDSTKLATVLQSGTNEQKYLIPHSLILENLGKQYDAGVYQYEKNEEGGRGELIFLPNLEFFFFDFLKNYEEFKVPVELREEQEASSGEIYFYTTYTDATSAEKNFVWVGSEANNSYRQKIYNVISSYNWKLILIEKAQQDTSGSPIVRCNITLEKIRG